MNYLKRILLLFGLFCSHAFAQSNDSYFLDAGDSISIRVLGEADLSFEVKIGLEGTIQYPFLGKIEVRGKTLFDLQSNIIAGLKGDYLDNPDVDISIVEYRPFYILGEVVKPQAYPYKPGLTVEQAVAIAGGFTERANENAIALQRQALSKAIRMSDVNLNMQVQPGDTITVSQSFF